jgi:hypothetical protein
MNIIEANRKYIEDALAYAGGTHTFDDIVDGIVTGRMQLWPAPRGCAVTEIVIYPKKKVLHVFLAGGEMDQLFDMIDGAAKWGRAQGCTSMTLAGRLGWQRAMKPLGWDAKMIVMEKEI